MCMNMSGGYMYHSSSGIALTRAASLLISPDLQLDQGGEKLQSCYIISLTES